MCGVIMCGGGVSVSMRGLLHVLECVRAMCVCESGCLVRALNVWSHVRDLMCVGCGLACVFNVCFKVWC